MAPRPGDVASLAGGRGGTGCHVALPSRYPGAKRGLRLAGDPRTSSPRASVTAYCSAPGLPTRCRTGAGPRGRSTETTEGGAWGGPDRHRRVVGVGPRMSPGGHASGQRRPALTGAAAPPERNRGPDSQAVGTLPGRARIEGDRCGGLDKLGDTRRDASARHGAAGAPTRRDQGKPEPPPGSAGPTSPGSPEPRDDLGPESGGYQPPSDSTDHAPSAP